jgi:hypothetical protein
LMMVPFLMIVLMGRLPPSGAACAFGSAGAKEPMVPRYVSGQPERVRFAETGAVSYQMLARQH